MYSLIKRIRQNEFNFYKWYYVTVGLLIVWSFIEGVGDIRGELLIVDEGQLRTIKFSSGYLTSLNYGIYYLLVLPFFLRAVFNTYANADLLSEMQGEGIADPEVHQAIKNYSSKIIHFLKKKWSTYFFVGLLVIFSVQNVFVQVSNYHSTSIGWVQGRNLMLKLGEHPDKPLSIKNKLFYQSRQAGEFVVKESDSTIVNNLQFLGTRVPGEFEFLLFVFVARTFVVLFTAVVFFFNFNILYGMFHFFKTKRKSFLFKSDLFTETMDKLISNVSLAGFTLTIFLYFRYVANAQKGSFQQFGFTGSHSDQYVFFLGVIFIPASAITLFSYVFSSKQTIDFKSITFKNLFSFYVPNIGFFLVFFIYLLNFDPYLEGQLHFVSGIINAINKSIMP